jgi:hypothetical protein
MSYSAYKWWESPKVHVLFCDVKRSAGDNGDLLLPRKYVETRIERWKQGFTMADGLKPVFQDFNVRVLCMPNVIFSLQMVGITQGTCVIL